MGIVLARIDERLVHGIVVTQWTSAVKAKRIMVVDDQVAQDEPRKAAMRLSKPAGTGMSLIDTETAITNFKGGKYLLDLSEQGIAIPKVNIGIMLDRSDRTKLAKNFAASKEELQQLQQLADKGIPVSYQFVPSDKDEPLAKFI